MLDEGAAGGLEVWGIPVAVSVTGMRLWPDEVKAIAVRKVAAGVKVSDIAQETGVRPSLIHKWVRATTEDGAPRFIELLPPHSEPQTPQVAASNASGRAECIVRLGGVEVAILPGFPADELTGILRAVRSAL
jgi:transposase-like protein